jgi:hypothetical protein
MKSPGLDIPFIKAPSFRSYVEFLSKNNLAVHFMDEDFLKFDGADKVRLLEQFGVEWIALASSKATSTVLREVPDFPSFKTCLGIEIGLENVDTAISDKEQDLARVVDSGLPINYLTMSFLPNETIGSLRATAEFVASHLFEAKDSSDGMKVAGDSVSTGQFFIPYEGTVLGDKALKNPWSTKSSEDTWTRQRPNFVGVEIGRQKIVAYDKSKLTDAWRVYDMGDIDQYESELVSNWDTRIWDFLRCRTDMEFQQRAMFIAVGAKSGALKEEQK